MLTREQILGADDLPRKRVEVPEWGGHVFVKTMTGGERDTWEVAVTEGQKGGVRSIRAPMAALVIVDETGACLFSEQDVAALQEKSCAALDRVFEAADKLNHITGRDIEELAINSETDQGDSSTSD